MNKIFITMIATLLLLTACSNQPESTSSGKNTQTNTETQSEATQSEEETNSSDESMEEIEAVEITEENYQSLAAIAIEYNLELTARAFIKAPEGMFDKPVAFVDAYIPYSEEIEHLDDGYTVQSSAHGIQVKQTMAKGQTAKEIVDNQYAQLTENENLLIMNDDTAQTVYIEDADVAYREVVGINTELNEPVVMILYADTKGNGFYLSAEISYLLTQTDELYENMIAETSFVFGLELPIYPAYEE